MAFTTGDVPLRAKARLIRTLLGDEMVSNEVVAIVEMVKNAYDADASRVVVAINPNDAEIVVIDDGHGMNREKVLTVWTQPATLDKKKRRYSLIGGRRLLGNKGIGRFASFRLGNHLEVVTRAFRVDSRQPEDTETKLVMDWSQLEQDEELYLDQVMCHWETTPPSVFQHTGLASRYGYAIEQGTMLRITGLAPDITWDREKLISLRVALSRLISPGRISDFGVELLVVEADLCGQIQPPEPFKDPDYMISGTVDAEGVARLVYQDQGHVDELQPIALRLPEGSQRGRRLKKGDRTRVPQCGPISIDLRVWDRDALAEKAGFYKLTTREIRELLDRVSGISVYRDHFRVFPYGEAGNDWLRLDLRRVQNPTLRISNNQVVGVVTIGSDSNPLLKDQSNREGFIHNEAVQDLSTLILLVMAELEQRRYVARRGEKPGRAKSSLFADVDLNMIRDFLQQKRSATSAQILEVVKRQELHIKARFSDVEEAFVRYRRLANMGKLIDEVLHEGRQPLGKIDIALDKIERSLSEDCLSDDVAGALTSIKGHASKLSHVFRKVEPFSGRKRPKPSVMPIEHVIENAFSMLEMETREAKVEVKQLTTQTPILINEWDMLQVFVNLLDNSLFWLKEGGLSNPRIDVSVQRVGSEVVILFCDNGPGVPDEYRELIFDPYFSGKPDGIGLGLVIVGEIVTEHNGRLDLLYQNSPLPGACFRIILPAEGVQS